MRTREYVERGETEGKTLLDAMRDGDTDGMQCFDIEIEKLIRAGVIDIEVGLSYATNVGNLRLQLVDLLDPQGGTPDVMKRKDTLQRPQKKVKQRPPACTNKLTPIRLFSFVCPRLSGGAHGIGRVHQQWAKLLAQFVRIVVAVGNDGVDHREIENFLFRT